MLSYTSSRNLYGNLTDNASSTNLSFGDIMINEGIDVMLGHIPWPFLEKQATEATVATQQSYSMPGDMYRLISTYIQVGTYKYVPTQVTSWDDWNRINNPTGVQSDNVSFFFTVGNTIHYWPIPATTDNEITFQYLKANKGISVADYTTGTIVTATNGSKTLTGSGTSWTAGMAGKWIRITAGNAANLGDGLWYEIASVDSGTQITLSQEYMGTSIVAGSAAYTMGDVSLIPEKYQMGPVYYAAAEYWRKNKDNGAADRFEQKFNDIVERMKLDYGTKTSDVVVDNNLDVNIINPNLNKSATP